MTAISSENWIVTFLTWKDHNGIVRTQVKPLAEVSLEHAKENSVAVNLFYQDKKFALLVDSRQIKSMTREALQHFTI